MIRRDIPDIIVSRLPVYLRALRHMQAQKQQTTSSQELGEQVGISAAQIRKDLSQFGEFGKQGTGYNIGFLIAKLREILQLEQVWEVALVGMGDMGHALARYPGFTDRGFRIAMVFDNDPGKIGSKVGGFVVHDMNGIVEAIKKAGIEPDEAEIKKLADNNVVLEGNKAQQLLKLGEALDDQDDVSNVWDNSDISEAEMEAAAAG